VHRPSSVAPYELILWRFELREFLFGAHDIGFLRAAEPKELLLPA
jgi:hypothetical protein